MLTQSCREFGVECIDVLVGEHQARFPIHKKLLTNNSSGATEYFSKNPTHTSIICPWLDPEHFSIIFNWLYKRPVPGLTDFDQTSARIETSRKIELCRCAKKLGMPGLVNMLISYIGWAFSSSRFWPSVEQIRNVYSSTHASAGLRLYMRHSYRFLLGQDTVTDVNDNESLVPTSKELESLMDCRNLRIDVFTILKGAHKNGPPTNPKEELVCTYHIHDEKVPADVCVFKGLRFETWDGSMPS